MRNSVKKLVVATTLLTFSTGVFFSNTSSAKSVVIPQTAPLAGMPAVTNPLDIYAADKPNSFSPKVKGDPEMVYVPNHTANTVSVIDPKTYKVIKTWKTPRGPQHVVPSWDLKTLWVNDNEGNYLTPINPKTVTIGKSIYVHDPYNLYFCLLYTSPSPRDGLLSRMPSSA